MVQYVVQYMLSNLCDAINVKQLCDAIYVVQSNGGDEAATATT